MKRVSPLNMTGLIKAFTIFFFLFSFLWAASSFIAIGDIRISWPIFIINLLLSATFGWWWYKRRYHTTLSYDEQGFVLTIGRRTLKEEWKEFYQASLLHLGGGQFAVRLYKDEDEVVEIPVSALRLNPQEFRFQAMALTKGEKSEG
jgi:hypothetical protein